MGLANLGGLSAGVTSDLTALSHARSNFHKLLMSFDPKLQFMLRRGRSGTAEA